MNRRIRKLIFIREKNNFVNAGFNSGLKGRALIRINSNINYDANAYENIAIIQQKKIIENFENEIKRLKIKYKNYTFKDLGFQVGTTNDDFIENYQSVLHTLLFHLKPN